METTGEHTIINDQELQALIDRANSKLNELVDEFDQYFMELMDPARDEGQVLKLTGAIIQGMEKVKEVSELRTLLREIQDTAKVLISAGTGKIPELKPINPN